MAKRDELTPSAFALDVVGKPGEVPDEPGAKRDKAREKERERGERYAEEKAKRRWLA